MTCSMRKLGLENKSELMGLFLDCFSDDSYYKKLFKNESTRRAKMEKEFSQVIEYCLDKGCSYGAFNSGKLVGFVLSFNYFITKERVPKTFNKIFANSEESTLPFLNEIHGRIDKVGDNVIYLLSLAVAPSFRKQGIGSLLVDTLLNTYSDYSVASDISNTESLQIYKKRGFQISEIESGYSFVFKRAYSPYDGKDLPDTIQVALPADNMIQKIIPSYNSSPTEVSISGYKTCLFEHMTVFAKDTFENTKAWIYKVSYEELLTIQRYINIAHFSEIELQDSRTDSFLLYCCLFDKNTYTQGRYFKTEPLFDDKLRAEIKSKEKEWKLIPDIQVLFPIEYESEHFLNTAGDIPSQTVSRFLKCLDFRTHYESGVPKGTENINNPLDFKKRIKRFSLGEFEIKIINEGSIDTYKDEPSSIGQPAYINLIASIDISSNSGVISLISMSAPFLISPFLDNIIRNQVYIYNDADSEKGWMNFYDFLDCRFHVFKRGTPKMFITAPYDKGVISKNQLASLLMAETIYSSDEQLGAFTDEDIMSIVESKNGMGQYDRAFVCASTNVLIQFSATLRATLANRIFEEAITLFYIELLMFEEAAIQIATNSILNLMSATKSTTPNKFLIKTHSIFKDYTNTMVFWDVQMNYPSSKKSVIMIREAFKIQEQISRYERSKEELQAVFDTKKDIMDRFESSALNYIILFLTLLQALSIVLPMMFQDGGNLLYNQLNASTIVTGIMLVYWISKKMILGRMLKKAKRKNSK